MNSAHRGGVYALIGLFMCLSGLSASGKDHTAMNERNAADRFQWREHSRLSWEDFKGSVNTTIEESAAATCCSIGFKTNMATADGKPEIIVYNSFYTNQSWVKADARIQSILDHEQGHFDLCEVYTRKLKEQVSNFDLNSPHLKDDLMHIYAAVSQEYESRQQAYEQETAHGTNLQQQRKWQDMIARELLQKEPLADRG